VAISIRVRGRDQAERKHGLILRFASLGEISDERGLDPMDRMRSDAFHQSRDLFRLVDDFRR
jgi:hypothetical protein